MGNICAKPKGDVMDNRWAHIAQSYDKRSTGVPNARATRNDVGVVILYCDGSNGASHIERVGCAIVDAL